MELLMVDGTPDGLCRVTVDNWNGCGIASSRFDVARAVKRSEAQRAGIYFLQGPDPDEPDVERVYIGEGDCVGDRLTSHAGPRGKEFWTRSVAFTSDELNKAHVAWLEAELIRLARASGRCIVDNATSPPQKRLSEADQARAERFLSRVLQVLPVIGISALEGADDDPSGDEGLAVTLDSRGAQGRGVYSPEGLRVQAGSLARLQEVPSASGGLIAARKRLRESGILVEEDGSLRFTRDHLFRSPSGASSALIGGNSNGLTEWVVSEGRPLGDAIPR